MHDLEQARAALAAAADCDVPITLMSAPGAARSQGVAYFAALVAAARREFPEIETIAILDCGSAPGLALAAFRHGINAVRVAAPPRVRARIADIAAQAGAALVTGRIATLDLGGVRDPRAACAEWLAEPGRRRKG